MRGNKKTIRVLHTKTMSIQLWNNYTNPINNSNNFFLCSIYNTAPKRKKDTNDVIESCTLLDSFINLQVDG